MAKTPQQIEAERRRRREEDFLILLLLLDANGEPYFVSSAGLAFATIDQAERLAVEGLEEDASGLKKTPAMVMRADLMAKLRDQARKTAIAASRSTATVEQLREASIRAAKAAIAAGKNAEEIQAAMREAEISAIGGNLPVSPVPLPAIELENENLGEQMDITTAQRIEGAKTVSDILDNPAFGADRATTIVRTETAILYNQAKLAGMDDDSLKRWHANPDACPVCINLSGTEIPKNAPFFTPYGDIQHPPAHPNCRCSIEEIKQ